MYIVQLRMVVIDLNRGDYVSCCQGNLAPSRKRPPPGLGTKANLQNPMHKLEPAMAIAGKYHISNPGYATPREYDAHISPASRERSYPYVVYCRDPILYPPHFCRTRASLSHPMKHCLATMLVTCSPRYRLEYPGKLYRACGMQTKA